MKKITVSSPAKLMLFGEHAVVFGRRCLAAAINERLEISLEKIPQKKLIIDFATLHHEIDICEIDKKNFHDLFKFVESTVCNFYEKNKISAGGVKIQILKHFSCDYGFGSSAAITAAVAQGLFSLFEVSVTKKQIFDLGYQSILDVQEVGSGFDLAASLLGGIVFFQTAGVIREKIDKNLDLIVCYTGVKASTTKLVLEVKEKMAKNPKLFNQYFDEIEKIVFQAKREIESKNRPAIIGDLMNKNQEILQKIGVSTEKIDRLLKIAKENGAYGGKISGAGGGDCIIIMAPPAKRKLIEKKLEEAGGKIINTEIDKKGTIIVEENDTIDDQNEEFVVVDKKDKIVGYKTRYECHHDKSLIHRIIGVAIFNNKGEVLLQKRSLRKDNYPGFYTLSCTGHVLKDESYDEAAVRELREELGISSVKLNFITKKIIVSKNETEIVSYFRGIYNGSFKFSHKEIGEIKFFPLKEAKSFLKSNKIKLTPCGKAGIKVL